jgi:transposase
LASWLNAHVHAFEAMGCLPRVIVPDNLASAVKKAHRYEPDINASYQEMAVHYGLAVIPARPRKARDKAKVEAGVLLAERWVLARLRNRRFYSLGEANAEVAKLVAWLNHRPFKKMPGSRRQLFEELECPVMAPLPAARYSYGAWKTGVKVNIDYHVEADRHYYSVPYQLVGQRVDVRTGATTVEVFCSGRRVASPLRSFVPGRHTTAHDGQREKYRPVPVNHPGQALLVAHQLQKWCLPLPPRPSTNPTNQMTSKTTAATHNKWTAKPTVPAGEAF